MHLQKTEPHPEEMIAGEAVRNVFADVRVKLVKLKDFKGSPKASPSNPRILQRSPGDCKSQMMVKLWLPA